MKMLVTGHRGYLGACVAELVRERGYRLEILDARLEALKPASLDAELVLHCAGAMRHRASEHQSSNVDGFACLLKALKPSARVLYVSSRAVYAPSRTSLSEQSALGPVDSYGASKLAGEVLLQASGHAHCILRVTLLIGAGVGQAGGSFLSQAFARMVQAEPVSLFEPTPLHDSLWVRDFAAWMLALTEAGCFGDFIFNASGEVRSLESTLESYAAVLAPLLGKRPLLQRQAAEFSPAPLMNSEALLARVPQSFGDDRAMARDLARLHGLA